MVVTARVAGSTQVRQVKAGSGFISSSSPILHFGLGDATSLESLEIRWPSGERQRLTAVAANQRLQLREPDQAPSVGAGIE